MAGSPLNFLWTDLFSRKQKNHQVRDVLQENVLFGTLSRGELKYLSQQVYERVYQSGESVFQQNDRGLGMYVISKGRVAIKMQAGNENVLVTTLEKGSFFGEIALVDPDNIRTATAIAVERTVLIGFFKPDLMNIMQSKPETGVKILLQLSAVLGRRLLETTEKITQLKRTHENSRSKPSAAA